MVVHSVSSQSCEVFFMQRHPSNLVMPFIVTCMRRNTFEEGICMKKESVLNGYVYFIN